MRINGRFGKWWTDFEQWNADYLARHEAIDALRDVTDGSAEARAQVKRNGAEEGGAQNIRRTHEAFCRELYRQASTERAFLCEVRRFYPEAAFPPLGVLEGSDAERLAGENALPEKLPKRALYIMKHHGILVRFTDRENALDFYAKNQCTDLQVEALP